MSVPRGRRRASQRRILLRRAVALVLLAGGLLVGGGLVSLALRDSSAETAPATTTAAVRPRPKPKPLRIVFPEGFTRAQMAARIGAVNTIAVRKRKIRPRLSPRAYLAATARSRLPGRFAGDGKMRPLEGFLFPATYEFLRKTTSKQLVARQLEAFRKAWAKVDLAYAR